MPPFQFERKTPIARSRGPANQPAGSTRGRQQRDHGSQRGKQKSFGQQLAGDARAAGAERQADADFLGSRRGSSQQQVGQVAARNQQYQAGDSHQHPERAAEPPFQIVDAAAGRLKLDPVGAAAALRGEIRQGAVERVERGLGLARGHTTAQAA